MTEPEISSATLARVRRATGIREISDLEAFGEHLSTPWALLNFGARTRSPEVLETMVAWGTGGRRTVQQVWDHFSSADEPKRLLGSWDAEVLSAAAILQCVLVPTDGNYRTAAEILHASLPKLDFSIRGTARAYKLAVQIATLAQHAELRTALAKWQDTQPETFWAARTDTLRAKAASGEKDPSAWWRALNRVFTDIGLEPFSLASGISQDIRADVHAATGVKCRVPVAQQPLISVIVPVYNPDATLVNAVESLVRQSWTNTQIILADDCSSKGTEYLRAAEALDSRVETVRLSENGGAYAARNAGLQRARGEFVTFQDADDQSHPRRLELQYGPLLNDSRLIATESAAIRVAPDGSIVAPGRAVVGIAMSSLLFRREPVLEALGRYDGVRKGADAEFIERLKGAFGEKSILPLPEPLSVVWQTQGSLSRDDFKFNWISEMRRNYKAQYRGHHERVAANPTPDWSYSDARPRSGWVPQKMLRQPEAKYIETAVLTDWAAPLEQEQDWIGVGTALAVSSGPIGLLRGLWPRVSSLDLLEPRAEVWEAVDAGAATWLTWEDHTRIRTLIVTEPEMLLYLPAADEISLSADRILIFAETPARRSSGDAFVSVRSILERIRSRFGIEPEWITPSHRLLQHIEARGGHVRLGSLRIPVENSVPGESLSAAPAAAGSPTTTGTTGHPIVGLVPPMREERDNWDLERVQAILRDAGALNVVCFDSHLYFAGRQTAPDDWRVIRPPAVGGRYDFRAFLAAVDVLLIDVLELGEISAAAWIAAAEKAAVRVLAPNAYVRDLGSRVTGFAQGKASDALAQMLRAGDS